MKTTKMPSAHKTFWIYSILLCLLELSNCAGVTKRCEDACRDVAVEDMLTVRCNTSCRQQQCVNGCKLWRVALDQTCVASCNNASNGDAQDSEVPMCMFGCRKAVEVYVQNIAVKLGNLPSPVLKVLGNTSVELQWQERSITNVTYRLQRIYTKLSEDEWHYHDDVQWLPARRIRVTNLHPFTSYRFRVVVGISNVQQLQSKPSHPIVTKPSGVPSGAPLITDIISMSSSIHIKWTPPFFVNAPLLPYKVTLSSAAGAGGGHGSTQQVMDVKSSRSQQQEVTAVVTMLKPGTEYSISVAARNRFGLGPEVTNTIRTKTEEQNSGVRAYLILGANHSVRKQDIANKSGKDRIYDAQRGNINGRDILYESRGRAVNIEDLAIHYYKRYIFVSDVSGYVLRLRLNESGQINETREVYYSFHLAGSLSVDWLHDNLYIAEKTKIVRCSLDGVRCNDVVNTLTATPYNITADPYNGYLYWVHEGYGQGLNRIDMADLPVHIPNATSQYCIFRTPNLPTYAVDYANLRIFIPNQTTNSMLSVYLDGSDVRSVHTPIQSSSLIAVTSLAVYNDRFYWTNGSAVFSEEYQPEEHKYHHNMFHIFDKPFTGLNIWHPSAQPIPVPLQKPQRLQAVFTHNTARLWWEAPGTDQGRGAWQGWEYEVKAFGLHNNASEKITCKSHQYRMTGLEAEAVYKFTVRAFTEGGTGPWSEPFSGETLKSDKVEPHLVYTTTAALWTMRLDGDGSKDILTFKPNIGPIRRVVAVHGWYLLVSERRRVYVMTPGRPIRHVAPIRDAVAVAYDWPARKLFWSNARNQILRSRLNGKNPEVIHQGFEKASDLSVDPGGGFMYWSTLDTVEVARLDGSSHKVIARLTHLDFHILGLALDPDRRALYWLVKEGQKTHVYKAALLSVGRPDPGTVRKVAMLEHPAPPVKHGLQYYSNRLFWMNSKGKIVVMQLTQCNDSRKGHPNIAQLTLPSGVEVRSFSLAKANQLAVSENVTTAEGGAGGGGELEDPEPVDCSRIEVSGRWDSFRLSWTPISVHGHAKVTYEVILSYRINNRQEIKHVPETDDTFVNVTDLHDLRPYSRLGVSIRSCTSWGCSETGQANLTTPMSAPSVPENPQGFVTYQRQPLDRKYSVDVDLHWSPSAHPNGLLVNYTVFVRLNREGMWTKKLVSSDSYHYRIEGARKYALYKFKVSACTSVGCSRTTREVVVNTAEENPVPQLLLATTTSISLLLPDAHKSSPLANSSPIALTFEAEESALYWIDRSSHILKHATKGKHTFLDVGGDGRSISVDWVGRALYWMEADRYRVCQIRTYNLDRGETNSSTVLTMEASGAFLVVHPYHSTLFWSEVDVWGHGRIMRAPMNGYSREQVLGWQPKEAGRRRRASPTCRCPAMQVSPVFQMDMSETGNGQIYFVDNTTGSIWVASNNGCDCRSVVDAAGRTDLGLPPDSIAVDLQRLYWAREGDTILHSILKKTGKGYLKRNVSLSHKGGRIIQVLAYGTHLQPMPDPACLLPTDYKGRPRLIENRNTSLHLYLPPWKSGPNCSNISLPKVLYKVHYWEFNGSEDTHTCSDDKKKCQVKMTYDSSVTLDGLKPFQKYFVEVTAENHHMQKYKIPASVGEPTKFITAPGVPSAPRNVRAIAVDPRSVKIFWAEPAQPNGELRGVSYQLHWGERVIVPEVKLLGIYEGKNTQSYSYTLSGLSSHTKYYFKVVAYFSENPAMGESSSQTVSAQTFSEPNPVVLVDRGQDWITVAWQAPSDGSIVKHILQFSKGDGWESQGPAVRVTQAGMVYNETATNLTADTSYDFTMAVWYNTTVSKLYRSQPPQHFITTAGYPGQPESPTVTTRSDDIAVVRWTPPDDGGLPIDLYRLTVRRSDDTNWTVVYNGSSTVWEVSGLELERSYVFRVEAHNSMGWGSPSPGSFQHTYTPPLATAARPADQLTVILAVIFAMVFIVAFVFICIILVNRLLKKHKPVPVDFVTPLARPADGDLVNLPQLPQTTRHEDNTLYVVNIVPTTEDVATLPHFRRDKLVLTTFLGSGAFGEVFEGVATNIISENSGDTKVAVKTLRKGASNTEKEEFLKEALLMANFAHTHILRLLGVCLHTDPQFIILELMEGGDLLSYLRSCRPTQSRGSLLTLADMVSICADVARGCKNLEDMHFVHRDLAARNCLVSSIDRTKRVVKIGDFGLARDIYKSDYYRKEGEGLLPVRWMSPESLIDGVFTTYSDVWAYGVLMWEVLTQGQQPYPARTNIEVLNYVCGGGRLDRPDNCPDDLYNVMLSCWSFSPAGRPSFNYILSQLEAIQHRSLHTPRGSTSSSTDGATVIYSDMAGCMGAPPVTSGKPEGSTHRDGTAETQLNSSSPYVQQVKLPGPPIADRSRPSRRPSPSPYLEPVSSQGGAHKYLELLGDDDPLVAAAVTTPAPPVAANPQPPRRPPWHVGRPHREHLPSHHLPSAAASGKDRQAPGIHYAQLDSGPDRYSNSDSDNASGADSPEVPLRYARGRLLSPTRRSAVDYAQLADSDEAAAAGAEAGTGAVTESHRPPPRGQCGRPGGGGQCTGRRSHGTNGWQQYAQIASTDSDTDSEVFERSRSRSGSHDPFLTHPHSQQGLPPSHDPHNQKSGAADNIGHHRPSQRARRGEQEEGVEGTGGPHGRQRPSSYTHDGYLAPTGHLNGLRATAGDAPAAGLTATAPRTEH